MDKARNGIADALGTLDLAEAENDEQTAAQIEHDAQQLETQVRKLEFQRMFNGQDGCAQRTFVDIQAGAGGTEAQDWAEMLLRMYLRWGAARQRCDRAGRRCDSAPKSRASRAPRSPSCAVKICLRLAPHRNRRAPPGAQVAVRSTGNRRPLFASVFVSPEIDDDIDRGRSTPLTSRWTCTVPAVQAASTSTRPSRRCASAHAFGYRRGVPERTQSAQEPRYGDEDAARRSSMNSK